MRQFHDGYLFLNALTCLLFHTKISVLSIQGLSKIRNRMIAKTFNQMPI
jgi:hypothetical protein